MAKLNLTFEDVENAARAAGVYDQISSYDWQLARQDPNTAMDIVNAKKAWNAATTAEARSTANAAAEAARAKYQYSGGSWGNEYNSLADNTPSSASGVNYTDLSQYMQAPQTVTLPELSASLPSFTPVSTPSFDTSKYEVTPYSSPYSSQISAGLERVTNQNGFSYDGTAPTYTNQYAEQIADALNNVTNFGQFSYDKNADPSYNAYAQAYRREGERAAQNALAQAATRSGGANSSATIAASQQAQNYYGAKLADQIPQLYQQAYSRYFDDFNRNLSKLSALNQQEQYYYAKHLTNLGQFNDDRNFALNTYISNSDVAYKALQGALAADTNAQSAWSLNANQMNADRNFNYGVLRDSVADQQWNNLYTYNAGMDAYNAAVDQQKLRLDVSKTNSDLYQQALDNAYKQQALAADIAQFNANYNLSEKELAENIRQFDTSYGLSEKELAEKIRQFDTDLDYTKMSDNQQYLFKLASAAADMGDFSLLNQLLSQSGGGNVSLDTIYALQNYGSSGSGGSSGKSSGSKSSGKSSGNGSTGGSSSGGIPGDVISQLKSLYPNGIITSKADWDALVSAYGESAVKSAGYSYKAAVTNPLEKKNYQPSKSDNEVLKDTGSDIYVDGYGWLGLNEFQSLYANGDIYQSTDSSGKIVYKSKWAGNTASAKSTTASKSSTTKTNTTTSNSRKSGYVSPYKN